MQHTVIQDVVAGIGQCLKDNSWFLGAAESCTGGLIGSTLTDVPGSSEWFAGGVEAYANRIKQELLGVAPDILDTHGAVSRETVLAMAQGAAKLLEVDVTLAVSGIAGPSGGTREKPVGTVYMAWYVDGEFSAERFQFTGNRDAIKSQTVTAAITRLAKLLDWSAREGPSA